MLKIMIRASRLNARCLLARTMSNTVRGPSKRNEVATEKIIRTKKADAKKKTGGAVTEAKGSSKRWLSRQFRDEYVKKASEQGYPSRASYKLLQIDEKFALLRPNMFIYGEHTPSTNSPVCVLFSCASMRERDVAMQRSDADKADGRKLSATK